MIKVQVNGLKEVQGYFDKLPKDIDTEIKGKFMNELAKNLQRRMRRRAPLGSTGWLRKSIMIEKPTKNTRAVVVHAFYADAVEKGRKNRMVIPYQFIEQHMAGPEYPGQRVPNPRWVNLAGTPAARPRPFVKPSVDSLRKDIPKIAERYLNKIIK